MLIPTDLQSSDGAVNLEVNSAYLETHPWSTAFDRFILSSMASSEGLTAVSFLDKYRRHLVSVPVYLSIHRCSGLMDLFRLPVPQR